MSLVRLKETCFCLRLSCLPSFTPNTKCLLSDVLSMLTGFLPHGDVGRYYLFLRSRYRQFLGIWRIAMTKKEAASRQGVERGTIPENQQMKEQQNRLNFKQTPCSIWPGRRKGDRLRPKPTPSAINPDQHLWNPQDCLNKTSHLQPS